MSTSSWPPVLQMLVEIIGREPALLLAENYGGVSEYIPRTATADHKIAKLIGMQGMQELCSLYGGSELTIPRGVYLDPLKPQIKEMQGKVSGKEIARKLKCSERYVRKVINEAPKVSSQSMLPGLS